jgi:hypothetical protein
MGSGRVPRLGDFLHSDDVPLIYESYEEHQKKFPDTPPPVSLAWALVNTGSAFAPVVCIEQEWHGTILDVEQTDGDPKCPNGHSLTRDAPLRLFWGQKTVEDMEGDDANCDTWMRVNFGHGPVEVRCTLTGEHEQHLCAITFGKE